MHRIVSVEEFHRPTDSDRGTLGYFQYLKK